MSTDPREPSTDLRERLARLSPAERAELAQRLGTRARRPDAIPRRDAGGPAPLSYNQELLWALDQALPGMVAYNVPRPFRVAGRLDLEALGRALNALVERHETLRTEFTQINGAPVQRAVAPWAVPVTIVDTNAPDLERIIGEHSRHRFDLAAGRLLRATVFRLGAEDHVVLLLSHHIVSDEWSRDVLFHDLSALYNGYATGRPATLAPLPVQYADYAVWQRESLREGELFRQLAYWRRQLENMPALDLPSDRPKPMVPTFSGARRRYTIPREVVERLHLVARQHGVTQFMLLLAAFKVLLARYCGQDDIVVGSPISSRSHPELEGLIGYFPNVLVLRTSLAGEPSFSEVLARVKESCLEGFAHQNVPLEKLALELRDAEALRHEALFRVLFLNQAADAVRLELEGAAVELLGTDFRTAKFDITLATREGPDGLSVLFEYSTDIFDPATIDRMASHFEAIVRGATTDPAMPVSRLALLDAAERAVILQEWNCTARAYPADLTLTELLERRALLTPGAEAVCFESQRLTFEALHVRANQLAHRLRASGVGPGVLVAICAERSVELMVGLLGILKAGGAYVPLDPEYPPERLAFMLADTAAPVLLTQRHLAAGLPPHAGETLSLDDPSITAGEPTTAPASRSGPSDLAYMIYTSGSTGQPKGALNTHRGIVNRLLWMQDAFGLGPDDTVLQKTPASFDVSVWEFFWPLLNGARLVLAVPGGHRDPAYLRGLIRRERVTVVHFVPSMLRAFLAEGDADSCVTLREVICSGEALPYDVMLQCLATLPARLTNLYGPTEAAVDVTWWTCMPDEERRLVPIGRPIANTQTYILDPHGEPVPIGVAGELYLGGVQVGRGYWNRSDLTAEKFLPDPFRDAPDAVLYRTGDRARYRHDGTIEFLGRLDYQVKLRGFRIELGEIEAAMGQHPALREAVVTVHPDESGEGRLIAYAVPRPEADIAEMASDTLDKWEAVFDSAYSPDGPGAEGGDSAEFNIKGWVSSYTLAPIPAEEMREWVDQTCAQIRALKPRRVLEIGCGTGLILFRIAPETERFVGIDVSRTGLDAIRQTPAFRRMSHVAVEQRAAHDLAGFPGERFDTIILNSVAQYFPSVDYLLTVLDQAFTLLQPGGAVFIGDVRSLPLLEALHTAVAAAQAPDDLRVDALCDRVRRRLGEETELVLDPAFFHAIRAGRRDVGRVEVRPKQGRFRNELTKFRYDVVLRLGEPPDPAGSEGSVPAPADAAALSELIARAEGALLLTGLRDRRIDRDLRLTELARSMGPGETVGALRLAADSQPESGYEPDQLRGLAPYATIDAYWGENAGAGRFDVRAERGAQGSVRPPLPAVSPGSLRPWAEYAHRPEPPTFSDAQLESLKEFLGARLPGYMVPAQFVRLSRLPLSPNGKVDRKRLRPPAAPRPARALLAPRTEGERAIAAIWAEVLHLPAVSVTDGFLELAGHSLQAMRIIGKVRHVFGVTLPLGLLLRGGTIAECAAAVDAGVPPDDDDMAGLVAVPRDLFRQSGSGGP